MNVVKWGATLGKEPQNFLGAKWIQAFLKRVPESKKHLWALRILSLSPHYFLEGDNPKYSGMSNEDYLHASFNVNKISREDIYRKILKPYLKSDFEVLDYGCGPGFLAKATAPHVKKIYAVDISSGTIACAKIINSAENIEYIVSDKAGIESVPDGKIDAVYSFAVIQHLTDKVFEIILENCRRKLKPDGQLILHIQLEDNIWQTEEYWQNGKSIKSKIKYQYGLHCFGRSEREYTEIVSQHRFGDIKIKKIEGYSEEYADELDSQRILTARKKS
ncbi:MAG: class I SAM-dependent methyltransferase [Acidobacteriota bacterium]|nr:class I SAM-dependent methyltransferase [Acidobacteriota bacterium]